MENLRPYKIPANIQNVEYQNNIHDFNDLEKLVAQSRMSSDMYFSAFTAMIHLEEASESQRISKFNFENVRIDLESNADRTFKIKYDVSKI